MTDRLNACLPFTLEEECPFPTDWSNKKNFSNNAHDTGGATMCGIIQREYDAYRRLHNEPTRPVIQITLSEGLDIYRMQYWLPHCDDLPPGLDLSFFDAAVNMGPVEAIKLLQRALSIGDDGHWGLITTHAVQTVVEGKLGQSTIKLYATYRLAAYKQMRAFRYFGTDWTRRTGNIQKASLNMAAN